MRGRTSWPPWYRRWAGGDGLDRAAAHPTLVGNKATYAEVKSGIDLVVEATVEGVESFYVVKNRADVLKVTEVVVDEIKAWPSRPLVVRFWDGLLASGIASLTSSGRRFARSAL